MIKGLYPIGLNHYRSLKFQKLRKLISKNQRKIKVEGAYGSSLSFLLIDIFSSINQQIFYISNSKETASYVYSDIVELIGEINESNSRIIVAKGGKGGLGNARFKSSTNQAPKYSQPGKKGKEQWVSLELKVLADVGLVGFPNAGKSTLLSSLSEAKPKIGDYPFTTLKPNLGVVSYKDEKSFIMADIPGIIEGASEGKGLGFRFLRHIERNSILLFLISITSNIKEEYKLLVKELKKYNKELLEKDIIHSKILSYYQVIKIEVKIMKLSLLVILFFTFAISQSRAGTSQPKNPYLKEFAKNGALEIRIPTFINRGWKESLVTYAIEFKGANLKEEDLILKNSNQSEIPFQLSEIRKDAQGYLSFGRLSFITDHKKGNDTVFNLVKGSSKNSDPVLSKIENDNGVMIDNGKIKILVS